MRIHELKCWPLVFLAMACGEKTAEYLPAPGGS